MVQMSEAEISRRLLKNLNDLKGHNKKFSIFVNLEGAKRDKRQQVAAKRHGMRPGRPDIEIFLSGGRTILLELKRKKGGRLTLAQKETHQELSQLGHDVRTIYAQDAATAVAATHNILSEYGVL